MRSRSYDSLAIRDLRFESLRLRLRFVFNPAIRFSHAPFSHGGPQALPNEASRLALGVLLSPSRPRGELDPTLQRALRLRFDCDFPAIRFAIRLRFSCDSFCSVMRGAVPRSRDSCDSFCLETAIRRKALYEKCDSGSDSKCDPNPAIRNLRFVSDCGRTKTCTL